jgi:hypothetical protein
MQVPFENFGYGIFSAEKKFIVETPEKHVF